MKTKKLFTALALVLAVSFMGCKEDDYVETIGVCPEVIYTSPEDDAMNVPLDKIISATFNEKMNPATITTTSYTIGIGSTLISGVVTYSDSTAYFTPNQPLLPETTYTGTIKTTVKDPMGNAIQEDYIWNFTTDGNPTVILTSPANLETGVPLNKIITAKFSEVMSIFTMNTTTFIVRIGTTPITGTVIYSDSTASFIPAVPLELNTTYNCTITTGAKNLNGSPLLENYNWSFVTSARIALSSNPEAGGTTSGGGVYSQGTIVNINAIPNIGYSFTNWTEGTTVVSTTPDFQFTMSGNRYLIANFAINTYTLDITAPNGSYTKTPNLTLYEHGSSVQLSANANAGYSFVNWTEGSTVLSTVSDLAITMTGNRVLVANFAINKYSLTVISSNGTVVKNPNQTIFDSGTTVSLSATPNTGYNFTSWSGDATGSTNPLTVTMNSNKVITANYTAITYTLNVIANHGSVVKLPNQANYNSGSSVILTAIPESGYTFTSWSGDATGTTNPLSVTMNSNKNITANFTAIPPVTYTLNVTANNGSVVKLPNQTNYNTGSSVVLTATPDLGYTFTSWSGDATGSTNPLNVTMNSNKNITANFTAILPNTFALNVTAINGSVAKNPNQLSYNSGSSVILTATPDQGYTFSSWSGDATGSINPLTVVMNSNKNITANFILNSPVGPGPVNLGSASDFVILTKAGISTTGVTSITGNIGVSPMTASGITGFGLIMDVSNEFSHTPIVSGKVYAADYSAPTPAKMTAAISDMETAYTTANGLTTPAPIVSLGAGDISGMTLAPGLYKWDTGLLISNSGVTLSGGANDTWVFQIAQNLTVNNSAIIHLTGGAQAKNIFWVVAGQATLGTDVNFSGVILSKTLISLNSRTVFTGRLFAQTAVTLNASSVVQQ